MAGGAELGAGPVASIWAAGEYSRGSFEGLAAGRGVCTRSVCRLVVELGDELRQLAGVVVR